MKKKEYLIKIKDNKKSPIKIKEKLSQFTLVNINLGNIRKKC